MQLEESVDELVEYILFLRGIAANLRIEVNKLSHQLDPQASPTYYEVYSDLCRTFEDTSVYDRFKQYLSRLIYE